MATKKKKIEPDTSYIADGLRGLSVAIDSLNPDDRNTVNHDKRSINQIAASLEQYGQDQPLVVQREGMIVRKGNGRWQAAKQLGWTHIAAVIVDDSDDMATGRSVADNRTADRRQWSYGQLNDLIQRSDLTEKQTGWDPERVLKMAERFRDPDTLPGGIVGEKAPDSVGELPASTVRMAHLFFDAVTFPRWRELLDQQVEARECKTESECVLQVLREARKRHDQAINQAS